MRELPPQLAPEFALDAMSVRLLRPPHPLHSGALRWALASLVLFAAVAAFAAQATVLSIPLAALGYFGVWLFRRWDRANPRTLEVVVQRGRILADGIVFETGDVVEARWDCSPPTTRLVLVHEDGREREVMHVMRRGDRNPGITRRQREWLVAVIGDQIDPSSSEDVPEGLIRLTRLGVHT